MVINKANLSLLYTAMLTAFNTGFAGVSPMWGTVAMEVPSSTSENQYGWLGQLPGLREWIGDRVVNNLTLHEYRIRNKTWEHTLGIKKDDIEDDQYGVYAPIAQEQGRLVAEHPDVLVYGLLRNGFSTTCYDGQYFFDTDHPVIGEDGNTASVSNFQGGSGAAWFLVDDSRVIKPVILQMRRRAKFVAKTDDKDDNVFDRNEFRYGVDGRWNVGFGLWQLAYASKQTLDTANYNAAYAAMSAQEGDHGRKLGTMPRKLVVGPTNRAAALEIAKAERLASGATNVNRGTVEVVVVPWLD